MTGMPAVRAQPGRPAQISQEQVVVAALEGNLDTLTMRELAARLGVTHRHNPQSFGRLRDGVVRAFTAAGVTPEMAEQSWYIFGTSVVSWLAAEEASLGLGDTAPRFELFLDVLLCGLPAREPGIARDLGATDPDGMIRDPELNSARPGA